MRTIILGVFLAFSSSIMADVLEVNIWKSMPGKNPLTMQYGQEVKTIFSKLGARATLGSDLEGRLHVATHFENWQGWAKFRNRLQDSPDWVAFLQKVNANPSAERENHYLLDTVSSSGAPAAMYQVLIFEPELGRGGDLVQAAMQAKAIHEKGKAKVAMHVDQLGNLHYVTSFDSWDAWAKFQDTPDPAFQEFMQEQNKDPTAKLIKVYTATSL